jgi:hypothetical protein
MFDENDLIDSYTPAEGLCDGVLIDVAQTVRKAGLLYPVASAAGAGGVAILAGRAGAQRLARLLGLPWV